MNASTSIIHYCRDGRRVERQRDKMEMEMEMEQAAMSSVRHHQSVLQAALILSNRTALLTTT